MQHAAATVPAQGEAVARLAATAAAATELKATVATDPTAPPLDRVKPFGKLDVTDLEGDRGTREAVAMATGAGAAGGLAAGVVAVAEGGAVAGLAEGGLASGPPT